MFAPAISPRSMSFIDATPSSSSRQLSMNALSVKRSSSSAARGSAVVLIEPLAGLGSQFAGVDQRTHPAVDVEAVAVAFLEVLGHVHDRVDSKQIGNEERSEPAGLRIGDQGIELLDVDPALLLEAPHLRDGGVEDAVDDESGHLGATDRHLADGLGERARRLGRLLGGVLALDD